MPEEWNKFVESSLTFYNVKNTLKFVEDKLIYRVKFLPFKPAVIPIKILITRSSGGAWKYNVIH